MSNQSQIAELSLGVFKSFESIRESSGAPFKPENLIDYLVDNPTGKLGIRETHKGLRYFWRFIRRLECDFGVCFSNSDIENLKSAADFTDRIFVLQQTPRSSLAVLSHRLKGSLWPIQVLVISILSLPLIGLSFKFFHYYGLVVAIFPIGLISLILKIARDDVRHFRALQMRIKKSLNS